MLMAVIGQRECRGQKIAEDVLFLCVSPVIFRQESAGLGVTVVEWIDVICYSQDTLLHLCHHSVRNQQDSGDDERQ